MLGFFGAAGLSPKPSEAADPLCDEIPGLAVRLQPHPQPRTSRPRAAVVDLFLRARRPPGRGVGVPRPDAAASCATASPASRRRGGGIVPPNRIIAKVSRVEVAPKFLCARPRGRCSGAARGRAKSRRASGARAPAADGGRRHRRGRLGRPHRQPAARRLLPDAPAPCATSCSRSTATPSRSRVGAAGGIATPRGGRRVRDGRGLRRHRLGQPGVPSNRARPTPCARCSPRRGRPTSTMAPAADMFEMGVKVQVLKRGTMFPMRAAQALRAVPDVTPASTRFPPPTRPGLEKQIFRATLDERWEETAPFFAGATRPDRAGRRRAEAQDGAGVPLVSRAGVALGERRRSPTGRRLPGLVRAGDGRVQRLGARDVSGGS